MEVLELFLALFIVFTLPCDRNGSQSNDSNEDELSHRDQLCEQNLEDVNYFKIGGMWLSKALLLK